MPREDLRRNGHEADQHQRIRGDDRDQRELGSHEINADNEAALEWEATLTDRDGIEYPIRVNVVRVRDGKFERITAYFDPTQFPSAGSGE